MTSDTTQVLVDMLELTGRTMAAAHLLNLSQPSVSPAVIAGWLKSWDCSTTPTTALAVASAMPSGCGCCAKGVNRHRLACGVLRIGGPAAAGPWIRRWSWVEWIPLPAMTLAQADALLQLELLDGVVLHAEPGHPSGSTELIPLTGAAGSPLWLCCRLDPLVLAIAQQQGQAPTP